MSGASRAASRPVLAALVLGALAAGCAAGGPSLDEGRRRDGGVLPDGGCGALTLCEDRCVDVARAVDDCGGCGRTCVVPGAVAACVEGACAVGACLAGRADCNADPNDGCEVAVDCTEGAVCTTTCGTTGVRGCADACAPTCAPPPEACNARDDDCDGACEAGLPGCRVGVHRAYGAGGHFQTTNLAEAGCCGFAVEIANFYWVHAAAADGLQPWFRCLASDGHHYATTDTAADGIGVIEGTMGFVAREPRCGAVPLYRLRNPGGDHFYTVSAPERDAAIARFGYADLGVAAYVWTSP